MTEQFSRPVTLEDLKQLHPAPDARGAEYLPIGGDAPAAPGDLRATTDIDLLVKGTLESGRRVKDALLVLPDRAASGVDPVWFEEGEKIRVADAFVIDLMLAANGRTCEALSPLAQTVDLDGIPVGTLGLARLLLTRQTLRDQDVADRAVVGRARDAIEAGQSGASGDPDH